MDPHPIVVLITTPSKEVAEQIATSLLEKKLAACVNIIASVKSLFIWKGETCEDDEVLLVVKSRADLFEDQIIPVVMEDHPYEVPEIIALPVMMGLQSYLDWINEVTES
jgi:periplasmic divalent cation tolerance protein